MSQTPLPTSDRSDDALEAARRLRRIAAAAGAGAVLDPIDADWLHDCLCAYFSTAPDGGTLEEAFALDTPRGGTPWWRLAALAERDDALRQYAREVVPDKTPHEQGKALLRDVSRYANAGWRFEQFAPDVPDRIRGTAREHLWRAMRAGSIPSTPAGIANVLAQKLKCVI